MNVHAGCKLDPEELPGLAHYLEHMLFMGSKKFSLEKATPLQKAVRHTGTRSTTTPDLKSSKLKPMLDRFAQFFIEPLFIPSSLERELKAVQSEFDEDFQDDHHGSRHLNTTKGLVDKLLISFDTVNVNISRYWIIWLNDKHV